MIWGIRLTECVKLLEDMERRGLLDMNKVSCILLVLYLLLNVRFKIHPILLFQVYHVRFFEACKRKKAIKEAFRYTKLIPNPTLSTFNMLMSVCASSQDSEGKFLYHLPFIFSHFLLLFLSICFKFMMYVCFI